MNKSSLSVPILPEVFTNNYEVEAGMLDVSSGGCPGNFKDVPFTFSPPLGASSDSKPTTLWSPALMDLSVPFWTDSLNWGLLFCGRKLLSEPESHSSTSWISELLSRTNSSMWHAESRKGSLSFSLPCSSWWKSQLCALVINRTARSSMSSDCSSRKKYTLFSDCTSSPSALPYDLSLSPVLSSFGGTECCSARCLPSEWLLLSTPLVSCPFFHTVLGIGVGRHFGVVAVVVEDDLKEVLWTEAMKVASRLVFRRLLLWYLSCLILVFFLSWKKKSGSLFMD